MSDNSENYNSFWHHTEYGKQLLSSEKEIIQICLRKVFGFHIVQIGCPDSNFLDDTCRINHKIVLTDNLDLKLNKLADKRSPVFTQDNFIPLETASIDAVVVMHALEFNHDPHAMLREIDRILMPEGHLIIFAFNPFSLWGLRAAMTNKEIGNYPWSGNWKSSYKIGDWLKLLNYDIGEKYYSFFRPCISNKKLLNLTSFFERVGRVVQLGAASFCISAVKKQHAMTPLKAEWQKDISLVGAGNYAKPTMRVK